MHRRIGIFGGTFDPIHNGHLYLAERVLQQLQLDEVIFVPAGDAYHRDVVAAAKDRLKMVQLAITGHKSFSCSSVDIDRPGATYSVDTLSDLHDQFSADDLFFIVGSDAYQQFDMWKNPDRILQLATLVVVPRPGFDAHESATVADHAGRVEWVNIGALDVSSTQCRQLLADNQSVENLVPTSVEEYIASHDLYGR